MLERGTFARCTRKTSSGRNTRKLHNNRRHKTVLQRTLNKLVHGHIRLHESCSSRFVDLEEIAKGADIDDGLACVLGPCAVGAAVEDAVGLFALEEAADGRGDGGDGLLVALHVWVFVLDDVVFGDGVLRLIMRDQRHCGLKVWWVPPLRAAFRGSVEAEPKMEERWLFICNN